MKFKPEEYILRAVGDFLEVGYRDLEKLADYYKIAGDLHALQDAFTRLEDLGWENSKDINHWLFVLQEAITHKALEIALEKYPEFTEMIDSNAHIFYDAIITNYMDSWLHPNLDDVIYDYLAGEIEYSELRDRLAEAVIKTLKEEEVI